MASPNRVLASVILTAFALVGLLFLLALGLAMLGAGSAASAATALRCLIAPVSTLDTAAHASAVTLGILAALPVLLAARAATRAGVTVGELRTAAKTARLDILPPQVVTAATAASVLGRIDVVDAPRSFAFTYGWVHPRVCISTRLVDLLDEHELEAVLHHELWHVSHRDPLRLLLAQSVGVALGAVPEIRRLVHLYVLAMEVAADRHVVAVMGHPRSLAGALSKAKTSPLRIPVPEGHADARAAALAGSLPLQPRGRGRVATVMLFFELLVLVPLLANGSKISLAGSWMHPIC